MRLISVLYNDFAHFDDWFPGSEKLIVTKAKDLPKYEIGDVLILHGGEDICPSYYKQKANKWVHKDSPSGRDKVESEILDKAISETMPIFGICRGAQWLSIKAGGRLIQHVVGHESGKHILRVRHEETTYDSDKFIWGNSCHHQQMDIRGLTKSQVSVIATHPKKDTEKYGENDLRLWTYDEDPEIVFFPEINGYAVQGHPEWLPFNSNLVQFCLEDFSERFTFEFSEE